MSSVSDDGLGEMALDRQRRRQAGAARSPPRRGRAPGRGASMSLLPKRRTSGARGAAMTAPTVRRPTLSRLARIAGLEAQAPPAARARGNRPPRRRSRSARPRSAPPPRPRPASRQGRRARQNPDGRSAASSSSQHRLFAAEQMGAAGDVEEQPVRAVERHQRRVAVAPVGEAFEQPAVGLRIGFDDLDRRDAWRARRRCPCRASAAAPQPARRARRCAGCCSRDG